MMWSRTLRRRANQRAEVSRRKDRGVEAHFESLEERMVMYQSPMVTGFVPLTQLENRNDSVVRILTNVGRIDIELFETLAPAVTLNFRNYISSGALDESFFHAIGGGILQGGKYTFDDVTRLGNVAAAAPIANGFSRSNLAQTLSMVPINATQATSQFLINLQDNPALNTASGGYTVFAKVIQGWDVVQNIQTLLTQNLNQALLGTVNGPFTSVPVTGSYNPIVGPTEATIIKIVDIETIKAPGLPSYFGKEFVYADGQRTTTSTETLTLVNEDLTNIDYVQVVVRYESGIRDSVIFSGSIAAGARMSLTVNDSTQPGLNLVRQGERYSYSVRSTRKMGVSFSHVDNGVQMAEAFQMTPQIPVGQFKNYQFAQATHGALNIAQLIVEDLGGQSSTINVNVYPLSAGGVPMYFQIQLEAFRRGMLDFSTRGEIPDGDFAIWATSTSPFMASLSEYRVAGASTSQGVQGGGRTEGALAGAYVATGSTDARVDVLYTGASAAVFVDFTITLTNGTVINQSILLTQAIRRGSLNLTTLGSIPRDQYFTIQYKERFGINPVSATFHSTIAGDEVSTPFQVNATMNAVFADGFSDPALVGNGSMSETISVFNPYANQVLGYDLLFHFSDGTTIFVNAPAIFQLNPLRRADYRAMNFASVAAKVNSGVAFQHYSLEVVSFPLTVGLIGGVVAQMTRIENTLSQAITSTPAWNPGQSIVYLDNPEFD